MTTAIPQSLTLKEFLKLPETKPASEFSDGQVYQKPMPQGKHSRLQLKFCDGVNQVAEIPQIALAFPELRCTFGGRSIVPDAAVFIWERIPFEADGEVPSNPHYCCFELGSCTSKHDLWSNPLLSLSGYYE
jgi:Uma2 family endonuclease